MDVLTADAVAIRPGAKVQLDSWGGEVSLTGRVRRVEPSATSATATSAGTAGRTRRRTSTSSRRQSVRLEQHYSLPVCSPTRSSLLSGRFNSRFGCTNPTNDRVFPFDTVTLAAALKSVGYETALVGKWHLGSKPEWGPQKYGFDHSYGSLAGGVTSYTHVYKTGEFAKTWHRNGKLIEEEGHVTDLLTKEAVRVHREEADRAVLPVRPVHRGPPADRRAEGVARPVREGTGPRRAAVRGVRLAPGRRRREDPRGARPRRRAREHRSSCSSRTTAARPARRTTTRSTRARTRRSRSRRRNGTLRGKKGHGVRGRHPHARRSSPGRAS